MKEKIALVEETKTPPVLTDKENATPPAKTVGETLQSKKNVVPIAKFMEYKNANKAAQKEIQELKSSIEKGASKKETSKDLKAIADEHGVDANFLQEFAEAVKSQAESDFDDKITSTLKPFQDKQNQEKINELFNTHYAQALEEMPEYKDVASKDVIKSLSLNPANADKTFAQILEGSYGHLLKGKSTMESSKPRGGKDDSQTIDYKRVSDPKYFAEIMKDPALKKEYNSNLIERLKL